LSAAQPAEQSGYKFMSTHGLNLIRDSQNPGSVLFASLRTMKAGQKFPFLREKSSHFVCHQFFLLKVGAELAEAPPGSRVREERLKRGHIAESHFSISECLLHLPVESFSLRRVEESVLHALSMTTQRRQFCLSGDATPPAFNPLQKAYVVYRMTGASGCEEREHMWGGSAN